MARLVAHRSTRRTVGAPTRALLLSALGTASFWISACGTVEPDIENDSLEDGGPRAPAFRAIISDPVGAQSAASEAGGWSAPAAASELDVVYVSLAPGSTDATDLAISNDSTGFSTTVSIVEGGFDPVVVPGSVGHTLGFSLFYDGLRIGAWTTRVEAFIRPIVVRTNPPRGKRDVPVASSVVVVFSEPMDPATVTPSTFRLLLHGVAVGGAVTVAPDGLSALFQPDRPLAPGATYVLSVAAAVRDLDGDSLAVEELAQFTTSPASSNAAVVETYERETPHVAPGRHSRYVILADGSFEHQDWSTADTARHAGRWSTLRGGSWPTELGSVVLLDFDAFGNDGCGEAYGSLLMEGKLGLAYCSAPYQAGFEEGVYSSLTESGAQVPLPPEAGQIAFVRDGAIYLANTAGGGLVQLTEGPNDHGPAWSPDGSRIAFGRSPAETGLTSAIYVMDANGSNVVERAASGRHPTWSPDGEWIAFECTDTAQNALCTVRMDDAGTSPVSIIGHVGYLMYPSWSPDGTRIAFTSDRAAYDIQFEIWAIAPDGSQLTDLTPYTPTEPNRDEQWQPVWSSDGTRLAYVRCTWAFFFCSSNVITVINADGSGARGLVTASGWAHPTWSPDGQLIAFASSNAIMWVSEDGSRGGKIIDNGSSPAWRP